MIKIIIFRHGQTAWNKEKRFQGHIDIPLSDEGKQEAKLLKDVLAPIEFDHVLSSDLKRARMTAEIALGDRNIPFSFHPELREADLGEAQGKTYQEVKALWGEDVFKSWFHATHDMKFPGGESKSEALIRFKNFIDSYLETHKVKSIALATHGYIIFRLLCSISEVTPENLTIKNCQAFEIDIDQEGNWRWVATLN